VLSDITEKPVINFVINFGHALETVKFMGAEPGSLVSICTLIAQMLF
jgi:hypothetical protein